MDEETLTLDRQLCFPLYAAARQVVAAYTPYLKPLGLTYTQYIVFLVLWEKKQISVRDLCTQLHLDTGTLTPVLKKMEEDGYLTRTRCQSDARLVILAITDKGEALKSRCASIPFSVAKCMPLCEEDARNLYRILYLLLEKGTEVPQS